MIVLKHLCKEFNLDARKLRQRLRKEFGPNRRWQWPDANDPDLIRVRNFLSGSPQSDATAATPPDNSVGKNR